MIIFYFLSSFPRVICCNPQKVSLRVLIASMSMSVLLQNAFSSIVLCQSFSVSTVINNPLGLFDNVLENSLYNYIVQYL